MPRAVLFDLDNTLLDRDSTLFLFLHRQHARHRALLSKIPPAEYVARVQEIDATKHGPGRDFMFRQMEAEYDLAEGSWKTLSADFVTRFTESCVPMPGLHQTLTRFEEQGTTMAIITNGRDVIQDPKIDGLGIRRYFQEILISETEGVRKPDPEIFRRALERLGLGPGEAVFVGDNPEADIAGAQSAGLPAVWMRNGNFVEPSAPDASITALRELLEVVPTL